MDKKLITEKNNQKQKQKYKNFANFSLIWTRLKTIINRVIKIA